jgi:hypothetical protein
MCVAAPGIVLAAVGVSVVLCVGCAAHRQAAPVPPVHQSASDARVLVCKGSGAFVTCRRIDADAYRQAMRQVQGPLTGSRIAPR